MARAETPRPDVARAETPGPDVAQAETPRPNPARAETPRPNPARPVNAADSEAPWAGADLDPTAAERGLRGLVGGGSSQVSPQRAMRARDAARPRPEDLARAEAHLQIIRRNWAPRD